MNRTIRTALTVLCFVFLVSPRLISQTTDDIQHLTQAFKNNATLMQALQNRKSDRSFLEKDLSLQQLSDLLWAANGVNRKASGKRTVPTARDKREIDVYVAMAKGLYLYDVDNHLLTLVLKEDVRALTGKQKFVKKAAVNLVFVADYDKMSGDRESKDFYSATDTGFIGQNVYLYCAAEGLATVVRGWVNREPLAKKMGLRKEQKIVLAQTVGYAK